MSKLNLMAMALMQEISKSKDLTNEEKRIALSHYSKKLYKTDDDNEETAAYSPKKSKEPHASSKTKEI